MPRSVCVCVQVCFCGSCQRCSGCGELAAEDSPVVYAERAGYQELWHPTCFVCAECGEALVDLVYFWKNGSLLCGRHYGQSVRPRCPGCDEVGREMVLLCCGYVNVLSEPPWK